MSCEFISSLGWLPLPVGDVASEISLLPSAPDTGEKARRLAQTRLDAHQLDRLGRRLHRMIKSGDDLSPLLPLRIALIGTGTLDLVVAGLVAAAARYGLALDCHVGTYGQAYQEALTSGSGLFRFKPDLVLISLDHRSLPMSVAVTSTAQADEMVAGCAQMIETMVAAIRAGSDASCIVQTIACPPERLFGSLDRAMSGTQKQTIDALNRKIVDIAEASGSLLLDVGGLADLVGSAEWFSSAEWNLAKLPFASVFVPLYAEHVARTIAASRGKSRKCLVLDLDNTLWGGVIGDDGLDGIKLAQGDPVGEAHLELHRAALQLRERGIVLAVSSKNTDEIARRPFREHPEMLLKEEHITVFQANWDDKATNIKAIAAELNFSLDAMVFVDDNPAERDLVRRMLPDVAVIELPEDPALYARALMASGCFEATSFSDEDRQRAESYATNARRLVLKHASGNLDDYLASLEMTIKLDHFDEVGRARISQLINKSNQFNLTTHRYTSADVARLETDPDVFTLQARLLDKFGDNGMISVVICRSLPSFSAWEIDTWLMSCRVLGRKVEHVILNEIALQAQKRGVTHLVGIYKPSPKNALVRDHYAKLGFEKSEQSEDGTSTWMIDAAQVAHETAIAVERSARLRADHAAMCETPRHYGLAVADLVLSDAR